MEEKDIKVLVNTDGRGNKQFRINLPKEWCLTMEISILEENRMLIGKFDKDKKIITLKKKENFLYPDEDIFIEFVNIRTYAEVTNEDFIKILDSFLEVYKGDRKGKFKKEKTFEEELKKNEKRLDKIIQFIENFHNEILPQLLLEGKEKFYKKIGYKLAKVLFFFQANFNFLHMEFFKGHCYSMFPYPNELGLGLWKMFQIDLENGKKVSYLNTNVEKELLIGYYSDFLRSMDSYKTTDFKLYDIEKIKVENGGK